MGAKTLSLDPKISLSQPYKQKDTYHGMGRGAFIGRADKCVFVTTGTFTRDAVREATRDGAAPIDLMDGDQLADRLKELRLGIKTGMVESVEVDADWFRNI